MQLYNNINFIEIFSIIYLLVLIGIAIIDKKEHKISKRILLIGFVVEAIQIIYLYINNKYHLIEYLIYLAIFIILTIGFLCFINIYGWFWISESFSFP